MNQGWSGMTRKRTSDFFLLLALALLAAAGFALAPGGARADNKVLGRVTFVPAGKAEKSAGVWVDSQYVGFIKELKGDKKILLMPGNHTITVRQSGYKDWTEEVTIQPGADLNLMIRLEKNPRVELPAVTSEVKLKIDPDRAAVFLDGHFVGVAQEFGGLGRAMLVAPGKHQIKIALVGYRDFTTEVNLQPDQKFTLKTSLVPASVNQADQAVKKN
jgi:hypothetical protein